MKRLPRRSVGGSDVRTLAVEAAGGLYIVATEADQEEARTAVASGRIRALEVQTAELGFLEGLPLEYLTLNVTEPWIEAVNSLGRLRGLSADTWRGPLDFSRLPALEWFNVTEVAHGQLERLAQTGHERLRDVSIGRYRWDDLRPLAGLASLERLEIVDSRALRRLDGVEHLGCLRALELATCPRLDSLEGIARAGQLEGLVIRSCSRVDDLGPVANGGSVGALMLEMRKPPSLAPLVESAGLEAVWLVGGTKRPTSEFDALRAMPTMTFIADSRRCWIRDTEGSWEAVPDIYAAASSVQARVEAGQARFREITGG